MKKLLCFIFIGVFLFASEYGKISGRVIDVETGEPLIGADVIVEGTELGAATDEQGDYTILFVPVGTYQVVASYISYDPYTYTNVIVNADQTTLLNFRVRPTLIEVKGVTAVAERPMVVISQTQTGRAVTASEVERLPVTTINQVITLQAGVVQSDLGTHIRGGRSTEITYYVDGIATKVPHFNTQSTAISPSGVQEITVVSGGFDAEYGDALSGIVNIITKEGGTKHTGSFRYLGDAMFSSFDELAFGYNIYNLSFGGPLPGASRFRYFVSGEYMRTDAYQQALYFIPSPRDEHRSQARFSYLFPNAKGKVTISAHNERVQYVPYGWGDWTSSHRYDLKYFDQRPMNRMKSWIASATFNYMATAKTLASLKLGVTDYERVYGNRDYVWEEENDRKWYEDYRLYAEHLIPYLFDTEWLEANDLTFRNLLIDSLIPRHEEYTTRDVAALRKSPYALEGRFYTTGDYRYWMYLHNRDYQGRFDIIHSVGKVHEFKTGLDFTQYNMQNANNNLPFDANPFWEYYDRIPYKIAYYIQDKMDFEGLIARLGVRVDYFDAKAYTFAEPENFMNDTIIESEPNYTISPRLGFSLPVTDRMKLRFNYGHYFQIPAFDDMYCTNDTGVIRLAILRGNTQVGNINLKPQKTVMYELGIENQLTDVFAVGFTAFFKDVYDLTQLREVPAIPLSYYMFFNVDYGSIKGFELNIQKRMSDMWAFGINYTLQLAKGTAASATEWYYDHYHWDIDVPVIDYWLDFDERHTLNANFDLAFPQDFFFVLLQEFSSSFVFSYHSGHPYTPFDLRGNRLGDENSARMTGFWNVNWNFSRQISIGPLNMILNGMIFNLFDTEQVTNVYRTTGEPDDHGDPEPGLSQFGYISMTSSRYSPQADYDHDGLITPVEKKQDYMLAIKDYYRDPRNWNRPFTMRLGIGIGF